MPPLFFRYAAHGRNMNPLQGALLLLLMSKHQDPYANIIERIDNFSGSASRTGDILNHIIVYASDVMPTTVESYGRHYPVERYQDNWYRVHIPSMITTTYNIPLSGIPKTSTVFLHFTVLSTKQRSTLHTAPNPWTFRNPISVDKDEHRVHIKTYHPRTI